MVRGAEQRRGDGEVKGPRRRRRRLASRPAIASLAFAAFASVVAVADAGDAAAHAAVRARTALHCTRNPKHARTYAKSTHVHGYLVPHVERVLLHTNSISHNAHPKNRAHPTPTGFFGVTPVIIAGTLHMKLPAEVKSLPIRSIQVATTCYETKDAGTIRSSSGEHILWEKRRYVWQPPPGQVEALIENDWDVDFRISIPPEAADLTKSTQLLREWRTQWRLEILIEHKPIKYVGEAISRRFTLNMYNHRTPPPAALPFPTGGIATIGKDLASTSHVFLTPPTSAFGPGDNVPLAFAVRVADPSTSVRKVQVVLERRLEVYTLDRGSGSRGPSPDEDDTGSTAPLTHRSPISNLFNRSSSPRRLSGAASASTGNLISTQDLESYTTRASVASTTFTTSTRRPPKVEIHKVGVAECELSSRGESGSYWAVGNISLPRRLPNGGSWDIGESGSTPLARISFSLYTKVWVKTKRGSSPKETVSPPVALTIIGVPEEDRARAAQAKATRDEARAVLAEARTTSRSQLKPKRSGKSSSSQLYLQAGDVDISSEHIASISRASLSLDKSGRMASPSASPPDSTPPVALRPILLRHDGDGDHIRNPHSTIQFVPAPDPNAMPVSPASTVSSSRGGNGGGISLPSLQSIFPSELYPSPASPRRFAAHEYTGSPHSPTAPLLPVPMEILDSEQGHDSQDSSSSSLSSQYRRSRTAAGGRRISSTTSDDEEQPLRNRPRLGAAATTPQRPMTRAPLPSLDALGFGLPALPEDYRPPSSRRPRTAPSFSAYSASGMVRAPPPPPLSGAISHDMGSISHDSNKTPTQEYPRPQGFSDSRAPSKRPSTSGSVFSLMRTAPPFGYSS